MGIGARILFVQIIGEAVMTRPAIFDGQRYPPSPRRSNGALPREIVLSSVGRTGGRGSDARSRAATRGSAANSWSSFFGQNDVHTAPI